MMKRNFVIVVLLFLSTAIFAQKKQADSLIGILDKQTTDTGKIRALLGIGSFLDFNRSRSDSAFLYLQEAVELSKKTGDIKLEAEAVYYLANNLINSANYPQALILSLENLKRLEQLNKEKKIRLTLPRRGDLLFYQTRLLVFIYSAIGDFKKQLEYVKKMQLIHASLPKVKGTDNYALTIFYNLGNAYTNLNVPDSSLRYRLLLYNEALKTDDVQWFALASSSLANYYGDHNKIDSSMILFRRTIPAAEKCGRTDLVVGCELHIGELFQKMNISDSAFYYTRLALQRLLTLNSPNDLLHAYKQLSDLYRENKQYDSAYKYINNFVVLKDSLQDLTKINEAQNFIFNQSLLDQQLEQAKKETRQQNETRIKLYALAGTIAFILLATFFLLRNLKNKRTANILLTKQKEEIQNSLSALKDAQSQLIQSEKMASLGELTAGIAHEIQNPLNFVNNFSEVSNELIDEMNVELDKGDIAEAKSIAADVKQNLEKINHHGKRADAIVKGMLQHSQASSGKKEPTDINDLCDEYLRLSYHGLRAKDKSFNATLKTDFDTSIEKINIISQDIGRVILNLLNNAFYAVADKTKSSQAELVEAGSTYEPTVSVQTKKLHDKIQIKVSDNGSGIPQTIVDKIFQPFFTTKPTGQGTGLGLSLSYDIIKAHGGEIKVDTKVGDLSSSRKEEGTTFTIQLPKI